MILVHDTGIAYRLDVAHSCLLQISVAAAAGTAAECSFD